MVVLSDWYDIPKYHLMNASHKNLLRLAIYIKLRHGLEDMSYRQLVKLVRWKLTRGRMRR